MYLSDGKWKDKQDIVFINYFLLFFTFLISFILFLFLEFICYNEIKLFLCEILFTRQKMGEKK